MEKYEIYSGVATMDLQQQQQQPPPSSPPSFLLVQARQLLVAMLVMDTRQYFLHHNKFLCRHVHSLHHRLGAPYSFGALYNHPVEGLLLDALGGALSPSSSPA